MRKELARQSVAYAGNEPTRSATSRVVVKLAAGGRHAVEATTTG